VSLLRYSVAFAALSVLLAACAAPHGQPSKGAEVLAPNEILDFGTLYAENCAGCHGAEGRGGAAIALSDPVYLAIADNAVIRKVIANGVPRTSMPAFAQSAGGMLTDKQADVITSGMRSRWSRPGILATANPPPYASTSAGNAGRGELAYKAYCESCHGSVDRYRRADSTASTCPIRRDPSGRENRPPAPRSRRRRARGSRARPSLSSGARLLAYHLAATELGDRRQPDCGV